MRLTPKQREFMESIFDVNDSTPDLSWECFDHERRTALSLAAKGLVHFPEGAPEKGDTFFMAGLTQAGINLMNKQETKKEVDATSQP